MKIIFSDINKDIVNALMLAFTDCPNVAASLGDIFRFKADVIFSPANSFGFMDGGIDFAYTKFFGKSVQDILQKRIREEFNGELLVGQAAEVVTFNQDIPWLISAPTMRVPQNISNTVNVYLSFKAALRLAKSMGVKSILSPGFGTCTGGVNSEVAARQMRYAYEHIINNYNPNLTSLMEYYKTDSWLKLKRLSQREF
jgi:O-acetyl-ADP-ribose deacetylase (regulator of RNase III)